MLALLIWALATYGLIVALFNLFRYFYVRSSLEGGITLVLIVCNAEAYIEGILRGIAYKAFLSRKELRIVVVDTGSQDATRKIVGRMQERDPRIEFVETEAEFDVELIRHLWSHNGSDSPYVLFDLRRWKNPRKIIPSLARIVG
ncbi:glycosyltransferase [Effusibacillus consociatus]|uniref:Glycosyltransferase n=1 Tax=Effusibacillus consociatus TaxID=1117041 RepID=A0ABV9Q7H9_9BACL